MSEKKIFLGNTPDLTRRSTLLGLGAGAAALGTGLGPSRLLAAGQGDAKPKRGGHFRFAVGSGSTADTLDPATLVDTHTYLLSHAICNHLVEIDKDKNPIGELAVSWESSNNARHWVFDLRKGVTFHNGKPFTSADVIYSINHHRKEDSKSAVKGLLSEVTDIRADGDHRVIFELSTGNADLPAILSAHQFPIIPDGHDDWTKMIGTGGYVLTSYEPGVSFGGERFKDYWKEDRAWFDSFEVISIIDPTSRTNALMSGQVDAIDRLDAKIAKRLIATNRFNVIENQGAAFQTSAMDARVAPLDNVDVRRALKYAVNREELLSKVNEGFGVIGNDHPVAPNDPFFNTELPQTQFDPEKARFHLKQAGHDSIDLNLSAADAAFAGAVDAAVLFAESAREANININVVREPNDGYWSNVWRVKAFNLAYWNARPTPTMMMSLSWACSATWTDGFYCNDRFEELMVVAKESTEFEPRRDALWEMQQILSESGANHVFSFISLLDAYAPTVAGVEPDAATSVMGGRAIERAWMA